MERLVLSFCIMATEICGSVYSCLSGITCKSGNTFVKKASSGSTSDIQV